MKTQLDPNPDAVTSIAVEAIHLAHCAGAMRVQIRVGGAWHEVIQNYGVVVCETVYANGMAELVSHPASQSCSPLVRDLNAAEEAERDFAKR